jgi:hypothetical protein
MNRLRRVETAKQGCSCLSDPHHTVQFTKARTRRRRQKPRPDRGSVRLRLSVGSPEEQVHQFLRPLNLRLPKPRPLLPLLIALLPGRPRAPLPLGPQRRHRLALLPLRVVPARRRSCRRRLRPWPRPRVALVQGGAERALAPALPSVAHASRSPATGHPLDGWLAGCRCNLFVWIRY